MLNTKKVKIGIKSAIVIAIALALIVPSTIAVTNEQGENKQIYKTKLPALNQPMPTYNTLSNGDVLVTGDNPDDDDQAPRVALHKDGTIVVVYERDDGQYTTGPVVYSKDNGATWTMQFEFDSLDFQEGSGILEFPDIAYSRAADYFFWQAIDPLATSFNEEVGWIPGDIENATEAVWWGISGSGAVDYTEGALTYVGEWVVALSIETNYGITACPGLGYFKYDAVAEDVLFPSDVDPSWAAGFYYDGQSVLETGPASRPELATGENRLFMAMERYNDVESYPQIAFKATTTNLDPGADDFLFTSGGGPQGMDKYADIEVWPLIQEYVANNASDPDVSAVSSKVAVVYTQQGDVKCAFSTDDGDNWSFSTVATGAGYPCVHVQHPLNGDDIYVAYVQGNNLYMKTSSDDGATWGSATQINDEAASVDESPGTADLSGYGIAWTDTRNGDNDIYFEYMELDPPIPDPSLAITDVAGGAGAVSATLDNSGERDAETVYWSIEVTGGILGRIDVTASGSTSLAIGETVAIQTEDRIFGLGRLTIEIEATYADTWSGSAFVLGPFILAVNEA